MILPTFNAICAIFFLIDAFALLIGFIITFHSYILYINITKTNTQQLKFRNRRKKERKKKKKKRWDKKKPHTMQETETETRSVVKMIAENGCLFYRPCRCRGHSTTIICSKDNLSSTPRGLAQWWRWITWIWSNRSKVRRRPIF